ncbi:hypothetical protein Tco_0168849 [Tanacetum coccineum]
MEIRTRQSKESEQTIDNEFKYLHINLSVLEVLAHAPIYNAILDKYVESSEIGKNGSVFIQERPQNPLLVGRGFLATANVVIDYRKAKIGVEEGITRSVFGVKEINLGEEEAAYWTTLRKRESYKLRPSSDGIGAQTPYYVRKEFMNYHFPEEWEIARDAKINPFKDVLVFRKIVEFLGVLTINLKRNMWESNDLIENPINWDKPPKNGDGAWYVKIKLIDPDGEKFTKTFQ